jgi:hypothetical protein
MDLRWQNALKQASWVLSCVVLCACTTTRAGQQPPPPGWTYTGTEPAMLAVNGFNYTDLPIDSFSVGGAGGGNIFVSSPTSGGGGTSCCVTLYPGAVLPQPMTVRWMRYFGQGRSRWCEKTVLLQGPIPDKPTAVGVHFMPDGDIHLEVARGYPKLKLRIENFDDGRRKAIGNVIHDEEVARCKDEP